MSFKTERPPLAQVTSSLVKSEERQIQSARKYSEEVGTKSEKEATQAAAIQDPTKKKGKEKKKRSKPASETTHLIEGDSSSDSEESYVSAGAAGMHFIQCGCVILYPAMFTSKNI